METSSDLSIRLAVAAWRASLPAMPADDVAELESHLLDSTAELQKTGLSGSEAFLIASRRLGSLSELAEEFLDARDLPRRVATAKAIARKMGMPTHFGARVFTALGVAALLVAIAIPLWLQLRPYSASVMLEILRTSALYEFGTFKNSPTPDDSRSGPNKEFFATQLEILTTPETLRHVSKKLGLAARWKLANDDQAARRLRRMVTTTGATGTNLTRVTVRSRDGKEAAELAEGVANAYIERRKRLEGERIDLVLVTLTQARKGQELIVERARTKMHKIAEALNVSDLPDGPPSDARSGEQVDPARAVPYNKANADYQLQDKILGEMVQAQEDARLTNLMPRSPATFHEHAIMPPDHSFLNSPVWWVVAGGSGTIGLISLVLGWRRKRRTEVPPDACSALHALA